MTECVQYSWSWAGTGARSKSIFMRDNLSLVNSTLLFQPLTNHNAKIITLRSPVVDNISLARPCCDQQRSQTVILLLLDAHSILHQPF